jgi:hypothetical protein
VCVGNVSCNCEQPRCCVYAAAAGALAYADGMSCTCDSSASAGSSLTLPSAAICAFLESGICGWERVHAQKAVAKCELMKQREHALEDASMLVMGITLHHGRQDAKHVLGERGESAWKDAEALCLLGASLSCSRATVMAVSMQRQLVALSYDDGTSCTCDSFVSAGSLLTPPSARFGVASDISASSRIFEAASFAS